MNVNSNAEHTMRLSGMTVRVLAVLAVVAMFFGCQGPTKQGKEARDRAQKHFHTFRRASLWLVRPG